MGAKNASAGFLAEEEFVENPAAGLRADGEGEGVGDPQGSHSSRSRGTIGNVRNNGGENSYVCSRSAEQNARKDEEDKRSPGTCEKKVGNYMPDLLEIMEISKRLTKPTQRISSTDFRPIVSDSAPKVEEQKYCVRDMRELAKPKMIMFNKKIC